MYLVILKTIKMTKGVSNFGSNTINYLYYYYYKYRGSIASVNYLGHNNHAGKS